MKPAPEGALRKVLRVKPPRGRLDLTIKLNALTAEILKPIIKKEGKWETSPFYQASNLLSKSMK